MRFAVVDIETTGSKPQNDGITEIGIYITDGYQIVNEFNTLINPKKNIPLFIQTLTGITNDMVADAPEFFEVAPKINAIMENCVFVAHNVGFDYSFLRASFANIDVDFRRKKLCSIRLSRKVFPKMESYSLGKLCRQLNIPVENRHRAQGDALATTHLLHLLVANDKNQVIKSALNKEGREAILPPHLTSENFNNLPPRTGIYLFHNVKGKVIYVGKAINIKQRVISHFNSPKVPPNEIHQITFEETGSELAAYILENERIKHLWPKYNSALKEPAKGYGIFSYEDVNGYKRLYIEKAKRSLSKLYPFGSLTDARDALWQLVRHFELCARLNWLHGNEAECKRSKCICGDKRRKSTYNKRLQEALAFLDSNNENYVILDRGRNPKENTVIAVEKGKYVGFGYKKKRKKLKQFSDVYDVISPGKHNHSVNKILRRFLNEHEPIKEMDEFNIYRATKTVV